LVEASKFYQTYITMKNFKTFDRNLDKQDTSQIKNLFNEHQDLMRRYNEFRINEKRNKLKYAFVIEFNI